MRPCFCLTLLIVLGANSTPADAAVITVYREVFPNDSVPSATTGAQRLEMQAQGWFGRQHGNEPFTPTTAASPSLSGQIAIPAAGSTELAPINSNPVGPTDQTGFLFWSPVQRAGIYLYTNEFPGLNTTDLRTITFESRNNTIYDPVNNPTDTERARMRLALLVGDEWYISDQGVYHTAGPNVWQQQLFDISTLTFGLFNDHNGLETPTSLPRNNDGSTGLSLPAGTVNAFGLYVGFNVQSPSTPTSATIRIDNFAIQAEAPVPEPATLAVMGGLFATAFGLVRGRRRK